MAITLTVDLKPEMEEAILAQARAQGVSLDIYVRDILAHFAGPAAAKSPGADQWESEFDEWVEAAPEVPHLSDEALRRESIYQRD